MANAPYYIGVAFQFNLGSQGLFSKRVDGDLVQDSLSQITLTGKGSRVMRRAFGCSLVSVVFDNMGPFLESVVNEFANEAISNFETRVTVNEITVVSGTGDNTTVDGLIDYTFNGKSDTTKIPLQKIE